MVDRRPDDAPQGRPSATAASRLQTGLRDELDRARLSWDAALLRGDAALQAGDRAEGARALEDQQQVLRDLCSQLDRVIGAAAVERSAEQVIDTTLTPVAPPAADRRPVPVAHRSVPVALAPAVTALPAASASVHAQPAHTPAGRPDGARGSRLVGALAAVAAAAAFLLLGGSLPVNVPEVAPVAGATTAADRVTPFPAADVQPLGDDPIAQPRLPVTDGWLQGLATPPRPAPAAPRPAADAAPAAPTTDATATPTSTGSPEATDGDAASDRPRLPELTEIIPDGLLPPAGDAPAPDAAEPEERDRRLLDVEEDDEGVRSGSELRTPLDGLLRPGTTG